MTITERAEQYALEKCGGKVQEGTKGMIYFGVIIAILLIIALICRYA